MTKEQQQPVITLDQWAAYMPYDVEVDYTQWSKIDKCEVTDTCILDIQMLSDWENLAAKYIDLKPHLHGLDKITQEIRVGEKTFIPAQVLWSVEVEEEDRFELYGAIPEYWSACIACIKQGSLSYKETQKLISWHFNVFSIPKELYIEKEP